MKLSFIGLAVTLALSNIASADYSWHMWRVQTFHSGGNARYAESWLALDETANCDIIGKARVYPQQDDVSGSKHGVRCKGGPGGKGCSIGQSPEDVEQLEMNFEAPSNYEQNWHWTIYKNRKVDTLYPLYGAGKAPSGDGSQWCATKPSDSNVVCQYFQITTTATRMFYCQGWDHDWKEISNLNVKCADDVVCTVIDPPLQGRKLNETELKDILASKDVTTMA